MSQSASAELHAPPRALPMPPSFSPGTAPLGWGAAGAAEQPFDEGEPTGARATEHDRRLRESLDGLDLRELSAAVARDASERGICFGTAEGTQPFRIDPIPRLIDAAQWRELSAGIAQRVRALELFVRDIYGAQRILADGGGPERGSCSNATSWGRSGFSPTASCPSARSQAPRTTSRCSPAWAGRSARGSRSRGSPSGAARPGR